MFNAKKIEELENENKKLNKLLKKIEELNLENCVLTSVDEQIDIAKIKKNSYEIFKLLKTR